MGLVLNRNFTFIRLPYLPFCADSAFSRRRPIALMLSEAGGLDDVAKHDEAVSCTTTK